MKTIVVTFAGRKKFLEILFKYIEKFKNYIDEYHIYVSTNIIEDVQFIEEFYQKNLNFVKLFRREYEDHDLWNQAWKNSQDPECVYIKFDDDILYIDETIFTDFLKFRKENKQYPAIYPMIINNNYCSYILQNKMDIKLPFKSNYGLNWSDNVHLIRNYINSNRNSKIEIRFFDNQNITPFRTSKIIPDRLMDIISVDTIFCPVFWGSFEYCQSIHNHFLNDLELGDISKYRKSKDGNIGEELTDNPPISINCVSWLGESLKEYTNQFGDVWQDEPWISVYLPIMSGNNNYVYYGSVVSHYSYYKQMELGISNTNILDRYRTLSKKI